MALTWIEQRRQLLRLDVQLCGNIFKFSALPECLAALVQCVLIDVSHGAGFLLSLIQLRNSHPTIIVNDSGGWRAGLAFVAGLVNVRSIIQCREKI